MCCSQLCPTSGGHRVWVGWWGFSPGAAPWDLPSWVPPAGRNSHQQIPWLGETYFLGSSHTWMHLQQEMQLSSLCQQCLQAPLRSLRGLYFCGSCKFSLIWRNVILSVPFCFYQLLFFSAVCSSFFPSFLNWLSYFCFCQKAVFALKSNGLKQHIGDSFSGCSYCYF